MTAAGVEPLLILQLVLLGCGSGFVAGMLGIGGGMMMVPFLSLILTQRGVSGDTAVKMAIATAMATILFTAVSTMRAHHRRGAVRWDIVRGMAPGIAIGGLTAGAGIFSLLKGQALALFFAAFIAFSATQMLLARRPKASRQLPGLNGLAAVGGGAGFLSGLVGAGGAFIVVPFMTWCNVPIHNAVATGAVLGLPIALANTVGYLIAGWSLTPALPGALGYIYLPALTVMAVSSMIVAPWGARVAHALDVRQLRRVFAVLLYILGADMLRRGLSV